MNTTKAKITAAKNLLNFLEFIDYRFELDGSNVITIKFSELLNKLELPRSEIITLLKNAFTNKLVEFNHNSDSFMYFTLYQREMTPEEIRQCDKLEYYAKIEYLHNLDLDLSLGGDTKYIIEKIEPNFSKKIKQLENILDQKTKISTVKFNDDASTLTINSKTIQLPPYKNEHTLCQAIYQYKLKEFVNWSAIFEKIHGENEMSKTEKKSLYDTIRQLNSRISETLNTDDKFITIKNNSIRRNY